MNIILSNKNCSAISVKLQIIVIGIKRPQNERLLCRLSEKSSKDIDSRTGTNLGQSTIDKK
jgi:hypothetical protein